MRLIDADVLIAPLKEEYKKVKQAFDETSVFQAPNDVALYGALMQEAGAVIHELESQPTVDAVPVIRCKDCKHSEPWYRDRRRCFLWNENGIDVFDDGYCNYGKIKAEREEE